MEGHRPVAGMLLSVIDQTGIDRKFPTAEACAQGIREWFPDMAEAWVQSVDSEELDHQHRALMARIWSVVDQVQPPAPVLRLSDLQAYGAAVASGVRESASKEDLELFGGSPSLTVSYVDEIDLEAIARSQEPTVAPNAVRRFLPWLAVLVLAALVLFLLQALR